MTRDHLHYPVSGTCWCGKRHTLAEVEQLAEEADATADPAYDGDACKCGHSPFDHRGVMESWVACKICSCKSYRRYEPTTA